MASIIFGLAVLSFGLWGLSVWWWSVVEVLRGLVPILLIMIGPVALGAGVTRLREQGEAERAMLVATQDEVDTLTMDDLGR